MAEKEKNKEENNKKENNKKENSNKCNNKKCSNKKTTPVIITEQEKNSHIDLYDIKQDILKIMIDKAVNNKLPKENKKKILKYIERKIEKNKSLNSVDSRINSLYETIKKQVDDYLMFCEID